MSTDGKKLWHLARDGEKFGPYTSQQLSELGKDGRITGDMVVWREGMGEWLPVSKVKGLQLTPVAPAPPPAPSSPAITVAVSPAPRAAPMPVTGHVTIEKTRKSLKAQQLLGLLSIAIGLLLLCIGASLAEPGSKSTSSLIPAGSLLFVGGLAWRIITGVRIWWHHG